MNNAHALVRSTALNTFFRTSCNTVKYDLLVIPRMEHTLALVRPRNLGTFCNLLILLYVIPVSAVLAADLHN